MLNDVNIYSTSVGVFIDGVQQPTKFLPSSAHMRPSDMSIRPLGQAHDILGDLLLICGAGRHK